MDKTRLAAALLAPCAALAIAAAPASAADYCVSNAACVTAGGTSEPTLEAALAAADGAAGADRVLLGAGTFTAQTTAGFKTLSAVQIIGAGSGATTLAAPSNTPRVLSTDNPGATVSDLAIQLPVGNDGFTKFGLEMAGGGSAARVTVNGNASSTSVSIGAQLWYATMTDSKVWMPTSGSSTGAVEAEQDAVVTTTSVTGRSGIETYGSDIHLDRDQVTASQAGIHVVNSATNIDATNTVVFALGSATGVLASTGNSSDAGIVLRNVTIRGDGTPGSTGVDAASNVAGFTSQIDVLNTIVRGVSKPLVRRESAGTSNLTVAYSDYQAAGVVDQGSGTFTTGPGNIDADPLFTGPFDLRVQAGSAVVDAGDPAAFADTLDLDGAPRVTDGDGNGTAVRDMGAFESAAVSPPPGTAPDPSAAPTTTTTPAGTPLPGSTGSAASSLPRLSGLALSPRRFRATRGTRISYAVDTPGTTRFTVRRRTGRRFVTVGSFVRRNAAGHNALRLRGRMHGRALKAGSYRLVAVPRDGAGHAGAAVAKTFRVI